MARNKHTSAQSPQLPQRLGSIAAFPDAPFQIIAGQPNSLMHTMQAAPLHFSEWTTNDRRAAPSFFASRLVISAQRPFEMTTASINGVIQEWKKVESPIDATIGRATPAYAKPDACAMLEPMQKLESTFSNGGRAARPMHPMSPKLAIRPLVVFLASIFNA